MQLSMRMGKLNLFEIVAGMAIILLPWLIVPIIIGNTKLFAWYYPCSVLFTKLMAGISFEFCRLCSFKVFIMNEYKELEQLLGE
jgi:hypothetical protein